MNLPVLRIGDLLAKFPIVQGGMAVRVSTAPLAAAVAEAGGVGTIAGTGISVEELVQEIQEARKLTKGIIGVNVLYAATDFANQVKTALKEKVDFIVSGAGFSRDMFSWGKEYNTPIVPIVSSARLAKLAQKMGAAAMVVEGKEAGGHLGTDEPLLKILKDVRNTVKLPVIAAGGIANAEDAVEAFRIGADGVQLGTRFLASTECDVDQKYKEAHINVDPEDIILMNSPVGLPGKAIRNKLTEMLVNDEDMGKVKCDNCLKKCSRRFCVLESLDIARKGDLETGLIFSGESAARIKDILPAKTIINNFVEDSKRYLRNITADYKPESI